MSKQQVQKIKAEQTERIEDDAATQETVAKDQQPLTDAIEDILDEIDNVLEVNAEEFVAAFVQKGGE